jgi:hypothetical protein
MKNLSFSCAFRVEIPELLPAKSSLSSYLPVALRGDLLRKNTNRSVLESPARSKTLGKTWNLGSNTAKIDEGLSFQPSVEKTSAAILHQELLDLGPTMSGTHAAGNIGLRWDF